MKKYVRSIYIIKPMLLLSMKYSFTFLQADGSFEIVAVTDIKKGEEITISYSWSVSMKSRKSRQEIIQNRFYFDCICKFCQEEAGYYNNDLKVYKEFGNLVEKLQEFKPEYEYSYYGQFLGNSNKLTTADLKKQLIILKEMDKIGKTKNLGEHIFDTWLMQ